jgi:hypothetical protein
MNCCSRENRLAFLLLPCLAAGVLFLVFASQTFAQSLPVALTPTRFEFAGSSGDTLTGTLEFWNGTDAFLPVSLESADFEPQGEAGHVSVGARQSPEDSLKDWVKPALSSLAVAPKQSIHLAFSIMIPPHADPGTHWGVILVKSQPAGSGGGSAIQSSVGAIVLLQVQGEHREAMHLESFEAPRFLEAVPVSFVLRLRNEGTVHLKPSGSIAVRNVFGKEVARAPLPEWNVLPGAVRRFEVKAGDGFWFGRYTAELDATYGRDRHIIQGSVKFWVVPWKTAGPTAVVWVGLAVFVIVKRENFKTAFRVLRTDEGTDARGPGRV